mmetsp:Transcript_51789/g.123244  ORF Transcript_51789/g.123244 Transcript_51789/m.123244 type:complete len:211 (-) Transcript_51789:221-853(-)
MALQALHVPALRTATTSSGCIVCLPLQPDVALIVSHVPALVVVSERILPCLPISCSLWPLIHTACILSTSVLPLLLVLCHISIAFCSRSSRLLFSRIYFTEKHLELVFDAHLLLVVIIVTFLILSLLIDILSLPIIAWLHRSCSLSCCGHRHLTGGRINCYGQRCGGRQIAGQLPDHEVVESIILSQSFIKQIGKLLPCRCSVWTRLALC